MEVKSLALHTAVASKCGQRTGKKNKRERNIHREEENRQRR